MITNRSELDAAAARAQQFFISKQTTWTTAATNLCRYSLWRDGEYPPPGSATQAAWGVSTMLGAMPLTVLDAGQSWYLHSATYAGQGPTSTLLIMDRLWQSGTFATNTTSGQSLGNWSPNPRLGGDYTNVGIYLELTGMNTAIPTVNVIYTNQNGTGNRYATLLGGIPDQANSAPVHLYGPLQLAQGDTGVQSVQTIMFGTAVTGGTGQVVLARPVATVHSPGMGGEGRIGYQHNALMPLGVDPCLWFVVSQNGSSSYFPATVTMMAG